MNNKLIVIIPARGGSKGLVGKNIRLLNGKPLIAYTIEAALGAENVDRVIVSTDDIEIARISKNYGAEIPFMRPDDLATDQSKSIDVYKYTIERLEKEEGKDINSFIILQPTSPLRNSEHINEAVEMFFQKNADSVVSYCEEDHPIFWHRFITAEKTFENIFEDDFIANRQEIKKTYYPNGAIYIFKKEMLRKNTYYTKTSYAYLMDKKFSVDIDTIEDFNYAEYLVSKQNGY